MTSTSGDRRRHRDAEGKLPFVTVIVPVYNDANPLARCLDALGRQTYPSKRYEVIVIDNRSEEDIAAVVASASVGRMVHEERRGSYAARNHGIRRARGSVIAFTDADCIPDPDWLSAGVACLRDRQECDFAGGRIDFRFQDPACPSPPELYDSTYYLQQETYVKKRGWAATANMFTWKETFDRVGLFRADLKSGGDQEWGRRATGQGGQICYAERARVEHPARTSYRALRKKRLRTIEGTVWSKVQNTYPFSELLLDVVRHFAHHVRFVIQAVMSEQRYDWRTKVEALTFFVGQGLMASLRWMQLWLQYQSQ